MRTCLVSTKIYQSYQTIILNKVLLRSDIPRQEEFPGFGATVKLLDYELRYFYSLSASK